MVKITAIKMRSFNAGTSSAANMFVKFLGFDRAAGLCAVLVVLSGVGSSVFTTLAAEVELFPVKDASLYSYDYGMYNPALPSTYPKADGTSHIHVGDTNKNNGVQRGLIQFDLSGIPAAAVVTDVVLTMTVADVPNRMLQRDVNLWMVAMQGLSQPWNEGPGSEQSPAAPGDTTWFHTEYDPALHGQLGNTSGNEFRGFVPGDPGYWPAAGYFGHDDLLETAPAAGVGGPFDDVHALVFEQDTDIGDTVDWSNARLVRDVQAWIAGTAENFGWIMVGEEWIDEDQQVVRPDNGQLDYASCKVDFFSSESAGLYYSPPALQVTYQMPQNLLPGDANGDGCVNAADAALLAANWQRTADAIWHDGDFNADRQVDETDATILAANWQTASTPTAKVPEASILVLLAPGLVVLLWQRQYG